LLFVGEEGALTEETRGREAFPLKAWVAGLLGWAVPGAGHLLCVRLWRGLLLGGVIWLLFFLGLVCGGHLFGVGETETGLLAYVFGFFDMGMGALYFGAKLLEVAIREHSSTQTSEYGNVFFMLAGLLNYLLALDAFDLGAGRKA
jgi:hypothetical protein